MRLIAGRSSRAASVLQTTNFTGTVWADPVLIDDPGAALNQVFFTPRSRTFWHVHGAGQILIVTAGSGFVVSRRTGPVAVRAGDVVWTEPGEQHWHGAASVSYLSHTAISLGDHTWLDAVTEDEYEAVDTANLTANPTTRSQRS